MCDRMRLNASKTPYEATAGDLLLLGWRAPCPSIRGDLYGRNLAVLLPSWRHDAVHKTACFQRAKLILCVSTELRVLFLYDHLSPADPGRRPSGRVRSRQIRHDASRHADQHRHRREGGDREGLLWLAAHGGHALSPLLDERPRSLRSRRRIMSASPGAVNWSGVFILSNEPP